MPLKNLRVASALAASILVAACSSDDDPRNAAVDRIFSEYAGEPGPGCSVGVVRDGEFLHKAGYGFANIEHGIPMGPQTPIRMASISKQFTAAAVLLLAQQEKLDLDADIHRYIPELPDYEHTVTLRHLLHHTSGLPSLDGSTGFRPEERPDFYADYPELLADDYFVPYHFVSISGYLRGIGSVDKLKFTPGSRYEYNNPGYFLAGQVVERVSGQTLREFAQENIFEPLGMDRTFFNDRVFEVVPGVADAYLPLPDGSILRHNTDLNIVGDGGVFTTIDDFYLWDQNFFDNRLGNGDEFLIEQMTTANDDAWYEPVFDNGGADDGQYGFGLGISETRGYRLEEHGGSWVGYRTQALRYPELRLSVYVFCNSALADTWDLSRKVADIYLPEEDKVVEQIDVVRQSWPAEEWEVSGAAAEGMDAAAIADLDQEFRSGVHGNVDSMLIVRNGRIVHESHYRNNYPSMAGSSVSGKPAAYNYFDTNWHPYYQGSDLHTLQSASKSMMSALVGIAIDRGDLPGTDATLAELLPHRNITDERKAAITLENVLRMQSGFEWEEDVSYWDPRNDAINVESTDDWVAYLLAKPIAVEQGTVFRYNSIGTQLLSEIVTTATGMPLDKFAEEQLFGPIGISDYFWKTAPEGFKDVSGGIYMKPRDVARFALLFERNGTWNGQQIVSSDWVRRSAAPYVPDSSPGSPDSETGYGLQWWIFRHSNGDAPDMYGAWGWGGQFCLIVPDLNIVAVFTGWNVYEGEDYPYAWELFYDRIVSTSD